MRSKPRGSLRLHHSKGNMVTSCRTWRNKVSKRRAEVESTSSPPVSLSCTTAHWSLKVPWLLPTTSYWGKHLCWLHSPCCRGLPLWKNSPLQLLPPPKPPLTRCCGEDAYRWNHSEGYSGRTPQLQEVRGPSLVQNTQAKPCQGV